jgi:hypothetical protein
MSPSTISLYTLAAIVGLAPTLLRSALMRSGVLLGADNRASELDVARVFGVKTARTLFERAEAQKAAARHRTENEGGKRDSAAGTSRRRGRSRGDAGSSV